MARTIDDELRKMLKEEADEMLQESNQPTTLLGRFFQEAGDDDSDEDEGESLDDIEKDMDGMDSDDDENNDSDDEDNDDDDSELGKDDNGVQNEYDENEVNTLNDLIADEQHAMQQYFKAGKETSNVLLARLYNDIGAEEAFHSEQLLYAKAELTGEKYEPSDPEVKKEYEELLENGMDEETAMYTIADKHKLDAEDNEELDEDLEDIEKDIESLGESFTLTMAGLDLMMAVQESAAYKNHKELNEAYCEYFQCAEETMFMEAMDNVSTKQGQEILGTNNPFIIIGRMIKSVYMAIINLVKKIKNWVNKRRIKSKRAMAWLKKHGIKGLFANGVKLYFYNDQTGDVEVSDAISYMRLCIGVTDWVAKAVGVQPARVTEPNAANGTAFESLKTSGKAIAFTSISDGARKIEGVVFSKSKIIVTDQNQADLENMFFGFSDTKFVSSDDKGNINYKSVNIYSALQYILDWASAQLKASDEWLEKVMIPAAGRQKGIAYTKPEVYRECVDAMKVVAKGYSKLIKCVTADLDTCMKLDQGLLKAVNDTDSNGLVANTNVAEKSDVRDSEGNIRYADKLQ